MPFGAGKEGSKIIVTTRNKRVVAKKMGTSPCHRLERLANKDCWKLFTRCAFAIGTSNRHLKFEEIGWQIFQKCNGLPLAIKTLGGILSSKSTISEWESILTSEIWKDDTNEILPALRLSYLHLPMDQKQCFAYCALFPKDHGFEKDVLVRQWMASCFIRPKGNSLLEDIGGEIFDDLLLKSFFQYSLQCDETSMYVMHDLFHELAETISGDECLRMEHDKLRNNTEMAEMARHFSWIRDRGDLKSLEALHKFKSLRTFLVVNRSYGEELFITDAFMELRCMRVLDLSRTAIGKLPDSIGHLKHLRYLDLTSTSIDRLPESVTSLYNLQTLVLVYCHKHKGLPEGITDLINLRYLALDLCLWYSISLPGIGKLTSLQTLPKFMVLKESGYRIGELKNMGNLKGRIHIAGLENGQNIEDAKEANLIDKKYLTELILEWAREDNLLVGKLDRASLQSNMHYLRNCSHLLPPDAELPSLLELILMGCPELKAFPSANLLPALTKLHISGCEKLSALPKLTSVCDLKLGRCGEKLLRSCMLQLRSLSIFGYQRLSKPKITTPWVVEKPDSPSEVRDSWMC
ncbi:putative disease resistance protein RGA3 [Tasmannia lanceolata]|uniref:putative disease resistance protein RGA3 n=1 Tax=Tasmannia lanceolata TaxID=3420 RepID=UPI0040628A3E